MMSAMASQITGVPIVYTAVCSDADQKKLRSTPSLAFVRGIHRWPVNSLDKGPVARIFFPFDVVITGFRVIYSAFSVKQQVLLLHQWFSQNLTVDIKASCIAWFASNLFPMVTQHVELGMTNHTSTEQITDANVD